MRGSNGDAPQPLQHGDALIPVGTRQRVTTPEVDAGMRSPMPTAAVELLQPTRNSGDSRRRKKATNESPDISSSKPLDYISEEPVDLGSSPVGGSEPVLEGADRRPDTRRPATSPPMADDASTSRPTKELAADGQHRSRRRKSSDKGRTNVLPPVVSFAGAVALLDATKSSRDGNGMCPTPASLTSGHTTPLSQVFFTAPSSPVASDFGGRRPRPSTSGSTLIGAESEI